MTAMPPTTEAAFAVSPSPQAPLPGDVPAGLTVEIVREAAAAKVMTQWQALDAAHPTPFITASFDWNQTWLTHYRDVVQPGVAVGRIDGEIVGLWLVPRSTHRSRGPIPLRTVHLGTAGEPESDSLFVEHNTPWVRGIRPCEFLHAVWPHLLAEPVDRVDADGISADLLARCGPLWTASGTVAIERRPSPWMRFDTPSGDMMQQIRRKTRSNFRRAMKQYDAPTTTWLTGPPAMDDFDTLVRLHQARWAGTDQPGAFAGTRLQSFLGDLVETGRAAVALCRDGDEPIGAALMIENAGRGVVLVVGFADTATRESPGIVSLVPIMQAAWNRGLEGFEFLVGDNLYKRMLSNETVELAWVKQTRPTVRSRLTGGLLRMKRAVRGGPPSDAPAS